MNKLMLLLLPLLTLQAAAQFTPHPHLNFTPSKPEAGKTVSYSFDLSATPLNGKTVGAEVVQFKEEGMQSMDMPITQSGNTIKGNIPVNADARLLVLNFYAEDNKGDEITETALAPLYDANGSLLAGCRVLMANVLSGRAYMPAGQVKTDLAKALACFEDEMAASPSNKKKYLPGYIALKLKVTKQEGREKMMQDLDDYVAAEKDLKSYQLEEIKGLYTKLKSPEKATAMNGAIKAAREKEAANGELFDALYDQMDAEKDAAKALQLVQAYEKKQASASKGKFFPDNLYAMVIEKASNANNWELADQLAKKFSSASEKRTLANTYNSIAWRMSGEKLDNKATDLPRALDISKKSVALMTGLIEKLNEKDVPPHTTARRYKKQLENSRGMFADTYALLLYKKGDLKEAVQYQTMAAASYNGADIKERLLVYKAKLNGDASILEEAEKLAKEGNASPQIMDLLKAAWTAQNSASGWEAYTISLQKAYKEKLKEEWKTKLDNYVAPIFNLKDMQGNQVSLKSLAGKVVVVDFWATWCGPCKSSFPGMQKAQDLYKDDPNVKFVFVDTWENNKPEKVDKIVGDFMAKNKYPFHVLMDYDNAVVESFGVEGIPTKFIIDGKGHVRFKAVGYGGTDQKVVDEITTLIELVKEQGNSSRIE